MSYTPTTMPPGGRGCGNRGSGGGYACCGVSENGTPIWNFLVDPVVPYVKDLFRGIQYAEDVCPELIPATWPDERVLLVDVIGKSFYKTMPSWVEETGFFGMSRNWGGFDFSRIKGRQPWLATIHARAFIEWEGKPDVRAALAHLQMYKCKWNTAVAKLDGKPGQLNAGTLLQEHYANCIYHAWPMTLQHEQYNEETRRIMVKWGEYHPLHLVRDGLDMEPMEVASILYPQATFSPGVFGIWPITHIECIDFVDSDKHFEDAGLPILVTEE